MTKFKDRLKEYKRLLKLGRACIYIGIPGNFDKNGVVIEYLNKKGETDDWWVKDHHICEDYIVLTRMYPGHQKEWDNLVFDCFNVEVDENFGDNIEKIFEKHSWIKSVFQNKIIKNNFSKKNFSTVWKTGLNYSKGLIITAILIGDARDRLYDNYEDPDDVPISACIGKNMIKDFLYKINQEKYPDFNLMEGLDPESQIIPKISSAGNYNINKLLKNENISQNKKEKFITRSWTAKLINLQARWMGESKRDSKNRIISLAWETIDGTQLSNEDKEKEKDELTKYRIY